MLRKGHFRYRKAGPRFLFTIDMGSSEAIYGSDALRKNQSYAERNALCTESWAKNTLRSKTVRHSRFLMTLWEKERRYTTRLAHWAKGSASGFWPNCRSQSAWLTRTLRTSTCFYPIAMTGAVRSRSSSLRSG